MGLKKEEEKIPPFITITKEECAGLGLKIGDLDWGDKIKPLAVAKGIPEENLYPGSTEISGFWDEEGTLFLRDHPGGLDLVDMGSYFD